MRMMMMILTRSKKREHGPGVQPVHAAACMRMLFSLGSVTAGPKTTFVSEAGCKSDSEMTHRALT